MQCFGDRICLLLQETPTVLGSRRSFSQPLSALRQTSTINRLSERYEFYYLSLHYQSFALVESSPIHFSLFGLSTVSFLYFRQCMCLDIIDFRRVYIIAKKKKTIYLRHVCLFVRLSVRPNGTTRPSLDGFS